MTDFAKFLPAPDSNLNGIYTFYLVLGAFLVCFGLFSLVLRRFVTEALLATLLGIGFGPSLLQLLGAPPQINVITLEVSRLVLAIRCLTTGIPLSGPTLLLPANSQTLLMLLGPVMIVKWLITASCLSLAMGISFPDALIMGACMTPTDPVLSSSILKGKFADDHIPKHLKDIISAESAANDGLGLPFLTFVFYVTKFSNAGIGFGWWLLIVCLYQIGGSIILGIFLGTCAREVLKVAQRREWTERESIVGFSLSLALFTIGVMSRLGLDEILGCFVVGIVISWDEWFNEQIGESNIQDVLDSLLNVLIFILIGARGRHAWELLGSMTSGQLGGLFGAVAMILLFRRLPIVLILKPWIPALHTYKEAIFCGWFGPIGAGAIFYAVLAIEMYGFSEEPIILVTTLCIFGSILVHGGSVRLFHLDPVRQRSNEIRDASRNASPSYEARSAHYHNDG
jgi:NhaP-type Na+/H+ or K+/H+ antiporter